MSGIESTACEEILYFGTTWEAHRPSEYSDSSPSLADSAPRESLWSLDVLEQDAWEPPTTASPAPGVVGSGGSRPVMVKANSFSEGVHDFDEMSHFLSSGVVGSGRHKFPHPHLHPYQHHQNTYTQHQHEYEQPRSHSRSHVRHHRLKRRPSQLEQHQYDHTQPPFSSNAEFRTEHSAIQAVPPLAPDDYADTIGYHFSSYSGPGSLDDYQLPHVTSSLVSRAEDVRRGAGSNDLALLWQSASMGSLVEAPRTRSSGGLDSSPPPPVPVSTLSALPLPLPLPSSSQSSQSACFSDFVTAEEPPTAPESTPATAGRGSSTGDLHDRFCQSFNNPTQRPSSSSSKQESVYQQLIDDKPLMEALSRRVKRGYYRCAHCPKMFSSILEYAKHIDEFQIQRDYKCPFVLCPWKILGLPRRPELRRHCAIQHKMEIPSELKLLLKLGETDFPIMECSSPYCDKQFYRRDSFVRHVAMVHDKTDSRFNKRLAKVLAECSCEPGTPEHQDYVMSEMMKTKRKFK